MKINFKSKEDPVKDMIDDAAKEAKAWETENLDDLIKKAKACKDISDADKSRREGKIDKKFVLDTVVKVGLFAAFAVWEERHVVGKTLGSLLRGGRV
jgi:hypothetical protein